MISGGVSAPEPNIDEEVKTMKAVNQYVLVTTAHKGVFFGLLEERRDDPDGLTVVLALARCAIRFGTTGGFLELAQTGPTKLSNIGSVAPRIELRQVTSISECTSDAVAAWERA